MSQQREVPKPAERAGTAPTAASRPVLEGFTFYPDYDDLTRLETPEAKMAWLEGRVRKVLIKPLLRLQVLRGRGQVVDINLVAVYAICGGIEALSHFYRGGKGKGHFVEFCRRYMPTFRRRSRSGQSFATLLYDNFRSALSHGFCIEYGRLELEGRHGRLDPRYGLEIDPWELFREFQSALTRYLDEASQNPELRENFEKRFDATFKHWIRVAQRKAADPPAAREKG
jgi:hypothetical protein